MLRNWPSVGLPSPPKAPEPRAPSGVKDGDRPYRSETQPLKKFYNNKLKSWFHQLNIYKNELKIKIFQVWTDFTQVWSRCEERGVWRWWRDERSRGWIDWTWGKEIIKQNKNYVKNIQIQLNMLLTHQTAKLQKDTDVKPITSLALIRW